MDVINLYGWELSQELPVNDFKWVEDISEFNKVFIKSHADERNEGCFLEVNVQFPENHNDLPFFLEKIKIENVETLVTSLKKNENMLYT